MSQLKTALLSSQKVVTDEVAQFRSPRSMPCIRAVCYYTLDKEEISKESSSIVQLLADGGLRVLVVAASQVTARAGEPRGAGVTTASSSTNARCWPQGVAVAATAGAPNVSSKGNSSSSGGSELEALVAAWQREEGLSRDETLLVSEPVQQQKQAEGSYSSLVPSFCLECWCLTGDGRNAGESCHAGTSQALLRHIARHNAAAANAAAEANAGSSGCHGGGGQSPESQLHHSSRRCLLAAVLVKPSRYAALVSQGLLPLVPADGVCFMPLDSPTPLDQLPPFDLLLHKASDELIYDAGSGRPAFSPHVTELCRRLQEDRPDVCIVDPLPAMRAIVDRWELCAALADLEPALSRGAQNVTGGGASAAAAASAGAAAAAVAPHGRRRLLSVAAPPHARISSYQDDDVPSLMRSAGLSPPYILKRLAACGVSDAHVMALVTHDAALAGCGVPAPAVAQQFIDHGGRLFKVYVAGKAVFYAVRPSIPDLGDQHDGASLASRLPGAVSFDSLKAMPMTAFALLGGGSGGGGGGGGDGTEATAEAAPGGNGATGSDPSDPNGSRGQSEQEEQATESVQDCFERIAAHLAARLGLTLFGFDVVRRASDGKLFVIDVNFFPSYKEAPDAGRRLRQALAAAHARHVAERRLG